MLSDADRHKMHVNLLHAIAVQEAIEAAHEHEPVQPPLTFEDAERAN